MNFNTLRSIRVRNAFTALFVFFISALPLAAAAFSFAPSELELNASEAQPSRTFTIKNPSDRKIAVKVSAHLRQVDETGKENLPTTKDFTVFPKQVVVGPRESRTVRITYKGPKKLEREVAYRVVAEQLPVDLKSLAATQGMQLKFLIKYQTSVYVRPEKAKADVNLTAIRAVSEKGKPKQLELLFANEGTAHKILKQARIQLRPEGADTETSSVYNLPSDTLKALETVNILAGDKRRVLIPWPKDLPEGAFTGQLELE